jgi:hypothetical protein
MDGVVGGRLGMQEGEGDTWREDKTAIMLFGYLTCSVVGGWFANVGLVQPDCQSAISLTLDSVRSAVMELRGREVS